MELSQAQQLHGYVTPSETRKDAAAPPSQSSPTAAAGATTGAGTSTPLPTGDQTAASDSSGASTADDSGTLAGGADVTAQRVIPHVSGPQYGMNIFVWDKPLTIDRDLRKVTSAQFGWQKTLFQWRLIEPERGVFDWSAADAVVRASNDAGVRVIARLDFQPDWARADGAHNGPPDNYDDFGDFVQALVDRYQSGSPYGTIDAIEVWNEPNLWRDWGGASIGPGSAANYVRLLCTAYRAAKQTSADIVVISAALTPTGTLNSEAANDVVFTQWMYDAGAKPCFDVLGAHGAGYKAPPWVGTAELAANPLWGGDQSFGFRRVEQLRDVMVRNGDAGKQIWLTEFGWSSDPIHPSYAWHRVSEQDKADYVVEAYRWAYLHWQPWIGVMVLWNIASPDWNESREEYWWSVTNPDGSTRPAYDALVARKSGYLPDIN